MKIFYTGNKKDRENFLTEKIEQIEEPKIIIKKKEIELLKPKDKKHD